RARARLFTRNPRMVPAADARATLDALYGESGDWIHAGGFEARFYHGDLAGAFYAARRVAIETPSAKEAGDALAFARRVSGIADGGTIVFNAEERLERAISLIRENDPQTAVDELSILAPVAPKSIKDDVELNRGIALYQVHRYEDAIKVLDPLAGGAFDVAIPAIDHASKSYRALANSINPIVIKTIVEKKKVGTVKVRKGKTKKFITKPKYANVKKNIQLVDLAKKSKKDEYDRLATERLKDLLQIKAVSPDMRLDVLNQLAAIA